MNISSLSKHFIHLLKGKKQHPKWSQQQLGVLLHWFAWTSKASSKKKNHKNSFFSFLFYFSFLGQKVRKIKTEITLSCHIKRNENGKDEEKQNIFQYKLRKISMFLHFAFLLLEPFFLFCISWKYQGTTFDTTYVQMTS